MILLSLSRRKSGAYEGRGRNNHKILLSTDTPRIALFFPPWGTKRANKQRRKRVHASKRPQSGFFANGNGTRSIANEDGNIRLIDSRLLLIAYSPIASRFLSRPVALSFSLSRRSVWPFPCNRLVALQTHRNDGRRRAVRGVGRGLMGPL